MQENLQIDLEEENTTRKAKIAKYRKKLLEELEKKGVDVDLLDGREMRSLEAFAFTLAYFEEVEDEESSTSLGNLNW